MTDYQFSQSSLALLERCITAASQPATKWMELLKPDTDIVVKQENVSSNDSDDTILMSVESSDEVLEKSQTNLDIQKVEFTERIGAILEAAPNKLEYLTEQCEEKLLPMLAEKLTSQCIEKICEELFINYDKQNENILLLFFPAYIKSETSCMALHLLIRGYKSYPDAVIVLLESLFTNTSIPNKLLEEFFIATNKEAQIQFLKAISLKQVTSDVFIHHLNTLNYLCKNCPKTLDIINFILNGLLQSADRCQNDKNYGRCLLTFFQSIDKMDVQYHRHSLEQILNSHKTPFKKPCQAILGKLLQ